MRIVHAINTNCPYDGVGLGCEPHLYSLGLPKGVIIRQAGPLTLIRCAMADVHDRLWRLLSRASLPDHE
jgi:hypothetical protein